MKILHTVESYEPAIGGMQEVVKQLSERLVKLGHDVTVATSIHVGRLQPIINGVKVVEFRISGNAVIGYQWGEVEKYRQFLLNSDFDVVVNFAAQQWATDLALPILPEIKAKKIFVPTGYSSFYNAAHRDYFSKLAGYIKYYDQQVFLSDDYRDINFARENGIKNLCLIPNGAASDEFLPPSTVDIRAKLGIPKDHLLILHVGSHTHQKGHAEAIDIFNEAEIRNATFLLVGNPADHGCASLCAWRERLSKWVPFVRSRYGKDQAIKTFYKGIISGKAFRSYGKDKKLMLRTLSREDTVAAYKAADLFFFPSNMECSPIVLFECMAAKLAFLTSEVGNSREIIEWSGGGKLLPTNWTQGASFVRHEESIQELEALCNDPELRMKLGQAGFEAWQRRFTWEKITLQYQNLYQKLCSDRIL